MSEIDQQFIEFVVKSLVGKPDAVQVKRTIDEKGVLLELTVDPEDLGRVIGKRGATAQSLRTLLRALGTKNDARYNLKIIDNGVDRPASNSDNTSKDTPADTESKTEDATPASQPPAGDMPEVDSSDGGEDDTPQEIPEAPAEQAEDEAEDAASDRLRKTREELADLDDLDV